MILSDDKMIAFLKHLEEIRRDGGPVEKALAVNATIKAEDSMSQSLPIKPFVSELDEHTAWKVVNWLLELDPEEQGRLAELMHVELIFPETLNLNGAS